MVCNPYPLPVIHENEKNNDYSLTVLSFTHDISASKNPMSTPAKSTPSPLSRDEFERLMWALHFWNYDRQNGSQDIEFLKRALPHGLGLRDVMVRACFNSSTDVRLGTIVSFLEDCYAEKPETGFFRRFSVVDSHGEDGMETEDAFGQLKSDGRLSAVEEMMILRNALSGRFLAGRGVGKDLGPTCKQWYFRETTLTPVVLGQWLGSQVGQGFSADFRHALYRSEVTSLDEYCLESFGAEIDAFLDQLGSRQARRLSSFLPPTNQPWRHYDLRWLILNPQTSPDEMTDLIHLASADDLDGQNRYQLWRNLVAQAHPATQIDEWTRTFQPPEADRGYWLWVLAEHHPCSERALSAFRELMEPEHREKYASLALRGCLSRQKGLSQEEKQSLILQELRASQEKDMDSIWRFLVKQTEIPEEVVDEIMKKIAEKADFTSSDWAMVAVMKRLLEMGVQSQLLLDQCTAASSNGLFHAPWQRTGPFLLRWAKVEPTAEVLKQLLSELDAENHAGSHQQLLISFAVRIGPAWTAEKFDAAIEAINGCGLSDSISHSLRYNLFNEIAFYLRHQPEAQEWLISRTERTYQTELLRGYFRQVSHDYQWDSTEDARQQTLREVNAGKPHWCWAIALAFWHGEKPETKAFLTLTASRAIGTLGTYEAQQIKRAARKALILRWPTDPDVQELLLQTLTSPTEEGEDDLLNEAAYLGSLFFTDAQRWHALLKMNAKRSEGCLFEYLVSCLSSGRQTEALEFIHELLRDRAFWMNQKRWHESIPEMILQLVGPRWDFVSDVKALTAAVESPSLQRELVKFLKRVMPKSLGGSLEHEIAQIRLEAVRAVEISTEIPVDLREMLTHDPSREVRCAVAEKLARHQPAYSLNFAEISPLLNVEDALTTSILNLWCETRPESWSEVLADYEAPECSPRTSYAKALAHYYPSVPQVQEALWLRLMGDGSRQECSAIINEWSAQEEISQLTEYTMKSLLWHEKLDAHASSACAEQLVKKLGAAATLSLFTSWHEEAKEADQGSLRITIANLVACLPTAEDFSEQSPLALQVTAWLTSALEKASPGNEYRSVHSALLMSFFQNTPSPKRRSNPVYAAAQNALMAFYSTPTAAQPG